MHKSMVPERPGEHKYLSLPPKGLSDRSIRTELSRYKRMGDVDWQHGRVSGAIYHGGDDITAIMTEAYGMFAVSNPLHPEVFPGVRQMEAEIVSMVAAMYHGPQGSVCGSVTSGGTESIIMAIKAYTDMAKDLRGVTEPELVAPLSVHPAFDKACHYFGVRLIHIPTDPSTGKVIVKTMEKAINSNTIALVGSAPSFPYGVIDPLPEIALLAKKYKIGFHIDACLGGFLLPFMEKAGFPLPHACDFTIDGVTSISIDPHKYGFTPKGSSVVLYRSKLLRKYQYFVQTEWPGGIYGSPSIAGSRPGALIAGCWATMLKLGEEGYVQSTKAIVGAAKRIKEGYFLFFYESTPQNLLTIS